MTDHRTPVPSTEFALEGAWFKSSYSDQGGGNCVEIADRDIHVGIRDSKNKTGPVLIVTASTWTTFIEMMRLTGGGPNAIA
ncbi:DUF397 domain-containing protein [Streptomyces sp. NPDC058653]|uniref:DUF397 domain-containing protein n=1 Tax=Streptomyces sp. NPDC058653 TaxID=3346576 RepID=UPI003666D13B